MDRASRVWLTAVLAIGLVAVFGGPGVAADDEPLVINVATVPTPTKRVTRKEDRPGWQIELFQSVEARTGVKFEYAFVPWNQAMRLSYEME